MASSLRSPATLLTHTSAILSPKEQGARQATFSGNASRPRLSRTQHFLATGSDARSAIPELRDTRHLGSAQSPVRRRLGNPLPDETKFSPVRTGVHREDLPVDNDDVARMRDV